MTVAEAGTALAEVRNAVGVRSPRRWHLLALRAGDLLSTAAAFFLAYHLRYTYELGGQVVGESFVPYSVYVPLQVLFVAFGLLGYQIRGSYRAPRSSLTSEAVAVVSTTAIAAMVVFAVASMAHYEASSRLTFAYAWLLAVGLGVAVRVVLRILRAQLYRAGIGAERVIVIGNNRLARMVMQLLHQDPTLGCRVLGFVDDHPERDFGRFRALGTLEHLPALTRELDADRLIVALPAARYQEVSRVLDQCQADGLGLSLVPDLFELRLSHVSMETVGGIPFLDLKDARIGGSNLVVKRVLDAGLSFALLITLSPLLGLLALAIRLDSPGRVFFWQTRLGKDAVPFQFVKFRSMHTGAEQAQAELEALNEVQGPIFKMREDPRLTRVGRFLRRMSLDELPQLWNVLRGEMSLIGPRPPIPSEVERYEDWHRRRLEVFPGITGLWQVSGRSELSFDEMVMLDLYYIENWSLTLDLQILARTIPTVLRGKGAF